MKHHAFLPKKLSLAILISFSLILCSCYSYRIATHAQPGTEVSKPIRVNSFFWGLVQSPKQIRTPLCDSLGVNGVAEVTVKNNFGYSLITVVTLGIWCPIKLQWKCSKPCQKTGTF